MTDWTLAIALYLAVTVIFTCFVLAIFAAGRDDESTYGDGE